MAYNENSFYCFLVFVCLFLFFLLLGILLTSNFNRTQGFRSHIYSWVIIFSYINSQWGVADVELYCYWGKNLLCTCTSWLSHGQWWLYNAYYSKMHLNFKVVKMGKKCASELTDDFLLMSFSVKWFDILMGDLAFLDPQAFSFYWLSGSPRKIPCKLSPAAFGTPVLFFSFF